jgi:hypothetical protein
VSVIEDAPTETGNGNGDGPPEVTLTAAGDPTPPTAQPLILNDCYFELGGVNLRCLVQHLEIAPENKPVTVTSFCAEIDYPGVTKWHLRVTFYQSFDANATFATLQAAYNSYVASGATVNFKARPYSSRVAAANNPIISGQAIPQPFDYLMGDAGAASQIQIDWNLTAFPTVDTGAVTATGATAGAPGFFTPSGATTPANLAALTGLTASPATTWGAGQFVITADLLANNWNGTTWVAGKHP